MDSLVRHGIHEDRERVPDMTTSAVDPGVQRRGNRLPRARERYVRKVPGSSSVAVFIGRILFTLPSSSPRNADAVGLDLEMKTTCMHIDASQEYESNTSRTGCTM